MVVCDHVWRDPSTGKHSLLGTFNRLATGSFPFTHSAMALYLATTDVKCRGSLRARIIDVNETRDPIFVKNGELGAKDPTAFLETIIPISGVTFPEPGEYRLQVFFNDEVIGERRLYAYLRSEKK
jgi:hypothetical protein